MPESRDDAVRPRLVVPNAAKRWLTLTNYDLFVYDDRLVAVKGLSLGRGALRDIRTDEQVRLATGARDAEGVWARERTRTEERVNRRTPGAGLETHESGDRIVVQLQSVTSAKLRKRAGIVAAMPPSGRHLRA